MTEEQIKQNAHDYTYTNDHNWTWDNSGESRVDISAEILDAHIAGAHSRDEEIVKLKGRIERLRSILIVSDLNQEVLRNELDKLRNPWISVEEKIPPIKTRVLFLDNNGKAWLGKNTISGYAELESDQPEILPPPTVPTCKPIITHWMPIPELKKGE